MYRNVVNALAFAALLGATGCVQALPDKLSAPSVAKKVSHTPTAPVADLSESPCNAARKAFIAENPLGELAAIFRVQPENGRLVLVNADGSPSASTWSWPLSSPGNVTGAWFVARNNHLGPNEDQSRLISYKAFYNIGGKCTSSPEGTIDDDRLPPIDNRAIPLKN